MCQNGHIKLNWDLVNLSYIDLVNHKSPSPTSEHSFQKNMFTYKKNVDVLLFFGFFCSFVTGAFFSKGSSINNDLQILSIEFYMAKQ